MKRRLFCLWLAVLLLLQLTGCGEITPNSLGIPYAHLDASGRVVWDLCLYDGMLYAAAGDYGGNLSPEQVMRYNFADGTWASCGEIHDEQINRFLVLNGDLYIPGTDPTGSWDMGAFYRLEDGRFVEYATVPHGVHTFDMADYDGALFVALGVDDDRYPVAVSRDGGLSFESVPFVRDGEAVPTANERFVNRCYDLFVLNSGLYAIYYDDLYRYDTTLGVFCYEKCFLTRPTGENVTVPIQADAVFANTLFYTTSTLYAAPLLPDGVGDPIALMLDGAEKVKDILVYGDTLYLLALRAGKVAVLATNDGLAFSEVLNFDSTLSATSFAYDGKVFYFGMGEYGEEYGENGEILTVAYEAE